MTDQEIYAIIEDAAAETSATLNTAISEHERETPLFGRNAVLDSLGLVALITAVETRLRETTGDDVLLVTEDAMSRSRSPFRSVGSLCDYISEVLNTDKGQS